MKAPPTKAPALKRLSIKNLTAFAHADLDLSPGLNVFVGENGTGKTHLLKLAYAAIAASFESGRAGPAATTKTAMQLRVAEKLQHVFRPEALGRLARRQPGRSRCEVRLAFAKAQFDLHFEFATNSKTEVGISHPPSATIQVPACYLPTRELLTIYPGFVAFYDNHYLEFDETWRDTCVLLGAALRRGPIETRIKELLAPLERAMGGQVVTENDRFYLDKNGLIEMPLVAEGIRKLGMIARLIATGSLLDQGYLFWDEPEANLNPRLLRQVAQTMIDLSGGGIQVFIATHSLFLLREIDILQRRRGPSADRFFGLHGGADGVAVEQGDSIDDIGSIAALDEELSQSDRFLAVPEPA